MNNIAILPKSSEFTEKARLLASKLNLKLLPPQDHSQLPDSQIVLSVGDIISLQPCGKKASGAVYVDFVSGAVDHRRKFGGGKGQTIAKAVLVKNLKNPYIIDATAGLGRDGFIFASLGARVQMIERNPIIAEILQDGLNRAANCPDIADIISRISLFKGGAVDFLANMTEKPDVIYLDPMFPVREKSALVKKEMRVLKAVAGEDLDAGELFEAAINKAKRKVVVKRPRIAPAISDRRIDLSFEGKANRFDVYINQGF